MKNQKRRLFLFETGSCIELFTGYIAIMGYHWDYGSYLKPSYLHVIKKSLLIPQCRYRKPNLGTNKGKAVPAPFRYTSVVIASDHRDT